MTTPPLCLVLSGGVALGAYEAGACSALLDAGLRPDCVCGCSIGAVNAAILAGNPPGQAVANLRSFWAHMAEAPLFAFPSWPDIPKSAFWREFRGGKNALDTLLFGRPFLFRPRVALGPKVGAPDVPALFDLAPLQQNIARWVDFDLLNAGRTRLSLCCTDVVSGDRVVFDTASGDRIGPEHIVASSALLPVFAPVEVEGRLLGDGALSANTPIDLVLQEPGEQDRLCYVIDLFAKAGQRPQGLAAAANRATDLFFANQTERLLDEWQRQDRLRETIARLTDLVPAERRAEAGIHALRPGRIAIRRVGYRAGLDEPGLLKLFDFSKTTLEQRWRAGEAAAREVTDPQAPKASRTGA